MNKTFKLNLWYVVAVIVAIETDRSAFLGPSEGPTYFEPRHSEATAQRIDAAVKRIIDRSSSRALAILTEQRAVLDLGARRLLEAETLDEDSLRKLAKPLLKRAAPSELLVEAA